MRLSKKIVSLLTVTALAASLTACGSSNGKSGSDSSGKKTYKIGICQLVEHNALDAATKGFKKALTDKLGKDNVEFDEQNAQGESTNCSTICNGFVTNGVDLIMANATGALQAAVSATNEIPIVGTSVTDYGTALNIKDWKGTSGTNVTGTADLAPIDKQEDMILEIKPDVKKVGILFCSSEPNSAYQAKLMKDELKKDKIEYKEYTASDSNEIQSVTQTACSEVDAIYIPTDNTMASGIETVKNVVIPAGIPVFAGEKGICEAGVTALSISYYNLGYQTGEMAYKILKEGADPGKMAIETDKNPTKLYNKENCDTLGIKIPDGYTEMNDAK